MEGRDVRDRGRIGDAAGLDEDLVRAPAPVQQAVDRAHQIVAHGAADAAVGEGEGVPAVRRDEVAVDVQLSEIVDQHRVAHTVGAREDAVQQGGLPRAQESAEDGHRDPGGHDGPRSGSTAGTVAAPAGPSPAVAYRAARAPRERPWPGGLSAPVPVSASLPHRKGLSPSNGLVTSVCTMMRPIGSRSIRCAGNVPMCRQRRRKAVETSGKRQGVARGQRSNLRVRLRMAPPASRVRIALMHPGMGRLMS